MPLSENEERILAEIERQLAAEDPRFAARTRRKRGINRNVRLRVAALLGVLGVIGLLSLAFWEYGVVTAAIGMAMLFTAILLTATALTEREKPAPQTTTSPPDDQS